MNAVMYPTAALIALAVAWKLYQLARAPHDRPLRAVTACIITMAASVSLGLQAEARGVDALFGRGTAHWAANVLLLGTVYSLFAFFVHSAEDEPRRASRRIRREAVPLAVTVAAITWAIVVTPADLRTQPYATTDLHATPVATFFIATQTYLVYSMSTTARWALRNARIAHRPSSTGLWMITASLAAMALANVIRVTNDLIQWQGGTVSAGQTQGIAALFAVAVPLFAIGVSYPAVVMRLAGAKVWWHHRRIYRRLRPLWELLHTAFPEDTLQRSPRTSSWRELLRLRGVHRGYYRRYVECRDGLVRVSPYLELPDIQDGSEPQAVAQQLRAALQAQAVGARAGAEARPVLVASGADLHADAQRLVALADALRQG